jgi:hypothetical protein
LLDAKWLDILKASGWKTAAVAAAAVLLIHLNTAKQLPVAVDHWVIEAAVVVALLCGCLTAASLFSYALPRLRNGFVRVSARRQWRQDVAAYIPQMTTKELEILGYLLTNNQRTFTNTPDCGHAATLVSKGLIVCSARPGQPFTQFEVPFEIPVLVWKVLLKRKSAFPRVPAESGKAHPWRVHWMSR